MIQPGGFDYSPMEGYSATFAAEGVELGDRWPICLTFVKACRCKCPTCSMRGDRVAQNLQEELPQRLESVWPHMWLYPPMYAKNAAPRQPEVVSCHTSTRSLALQPGLGKCPC